jgi:hypothetical protein
MIFNVIITMVCFIVQMIFSVIVAMVCFSIRMTFNVVVMRGNRLLRLLPGLSERGKGRHLEPSQGRDNMEKDEEQPIRAR